MCKFSKLGELRKILIIADSTETDWRSLTFIPGVGQQLGQLGSKDGRSLHCSLLRLLADKTPEEIDKLPVPSPDRNLRVREVRGVLAAAPTLAGQGAAGLVQVGQVAARPAAAAVRGSPWKYFVSFTV